MGEFRRINKTLFLILILQFTAVTGQARLSFSVRAGDEVTLPCVNVTKYQNKCNSTSWLSSGSFGETAGELISLGKTKSVISKAKSDRLSMTANCSLVIKKVTRDDVGRYSCRQFDESGRQVSDARVFLSVVTMDEHKSDVLVILYCSVLTYEGCEHTVKWLYEGNKNDVEISLHTCSASVRFTPHLNPKSKYYESLKCNVTNKKNGETLLSDVGPQSLFEKTGGTSAGRNNTTSAPKVSIQDWLWLYITLAVGLAVLLATIIAAVVIRRKRNKGNKKPMDENYGQSLNPAVTQPDPETSQDMADPEDGVSYASVSYTKKTNSKVQAQCKGDDDEGDAVTYSTVKTSPSAAAAAAAVGDSADPSNLYATVNNANQ